MARSHVMSITSSTQRCMSKNLQIIALHVVGVCLSSARVLSCARSYQVPRYLGVQYVKGNLFRHFVKFWDASLTRRLRRLPSHMSLIAGIWPGLGHGHLLVDGTRAESGWDGRVLDPRTNQNQQKPRCPSGAGPEVKAKLTRVKIN